MEPVSPVSIHSRHHSIRSPCTGVQSPSNDPRRESIHSPDAFPIASTSIWAAERSNSVHCKQSRANSHRDIVYSPPSPSALPIPSTSVWGNHRSYSIISRPSLTNKTSNKDIEPLVNGFVRNIQSLLHQLVADGIRALVCDYLNGEHFCESKIDDRNEWIAHFGSDLRSPDDDMMTITNISSGFVCAFGNVMIHSVTPRVHRWKFQTQKFGKIVQFGITNQMEGDITSFDGKGSYGMSYPPGTEVEMTLDLGTRELKFFYDGIPCLYYNDLECGERIYYRMVIVMRSQGAKVRLLDYTVSKSTGKCLVIE